MKTINLKISAVLVVCCLASLSAPTAQADERKVTPSLGMREEYNDNLFVTQDNRAHDTITTFSPGLAYSQRSERSQLDLQGRIDSVRYADRNDLDSTDKEVKGNAGYSLSERFWLGADGLWSRDSRLGRDLETTGLAFSATSRTRQNYNLSGRLQVSQKDMLQMTAGMSQDRYTDQEFSDVDGKTGRLTWSSDFSRYFNNLIVQSLIDYGRYEYITAKVDTYTVGIGGEKKISEVWSINGWLGPSFTKTEYLFGTVRNAKDTGLSGSLGVERTWDTSSLALTLSQSVAPDSGRNSTVTRSSFNAKYRKQLTKDLDLGLNISYFLNKTNSDTPSLSLNEVNYQIAPNVSYRFNNDIRLESFYQHMYIDDKTDGTENTRQRNLIFMKIVFSHTFD
ncbi:MAG: outer membrane beta-barrel protein [Rectinemataceae bacterium]|nr:outer membrane beta-barrel protein [Rectinemataceae bacterium]